MDKSRVRKALQELEDLMKVRRIMIRPSGPQKGVQKLSEKETKEAEKKAKKIKASAAAAESKIGARSIKDLRAGQMAQAQLGRKGSSDARIGVGAPVVKEEKGHKPKVSSANAARLTEWAIRGDEEAKRQLKERKKEKDLKKNFYDILDKLHKGLETIKDDLVKGKGFAWGGGGQAPWGAAVKNKPAPKNRSGVVKLSPDKMREHVRSRDRNRQMKMVQHHFGHLSDEDHKDLSNSPHEDVRNAYKQKKND